MTSDQLQTRCNLIAVTILVSVIVYAIISMIPTSVLSSIVNGGR
jgi:hypothetical protein